MTTQKHVTTVDMIRHGEPVGGKKYRGHRDDPLSEKGWGQMRTAVGDVCHWDALVSSPLLRCAAFAEDLSATYCLPLTYDARWKEIGFGVWEGKTADEIALEDPAALRQFFDDPVTFCPEGAEPLALFNQRVVEVFNELLVAHRGQRVLVVAHAGVIRMVLQHVLAIPFSHVFRIDVPNAGVTRFEIYSDETGAHPKLMFHAGSLR